MTNFSEIDLYPVTGREHFLGRMTDEEAISQLAEGGAKIVQLREKGLCDRELYELALLYRRETARHGMLLIINDRPDICIAVSADGVHLGQDDLPVKEARKVLGADKIIGASAHNVEQAIEAQSEGATYVNIGPVFDTPTKPGVTGIGVEPLKEAIDALDLPVTTMGGIGSDNIDLPLSAGAKHIGVVTAVFGSENIADSVKNLIHKIETYSTN